MFYYFLGSLIMTAAMLIIAFFIVYEDVTNGHDFEVSYEAVIVFVCLCASSWLGVLLLTTGALCDIFGADLDKPLFTIKGHNK